MSPLQTSTPLLGDKSTNLYGYDGNIGTVSTEDVVNVVGNNPSLSFVMVILGIFTFNLVSLKSCAYSRLISIVFRDRSHITLSIFKQIYK